MIDVCGVIGVKADQARTGCVGNFRIQGEDDEVIVVGAGLHSVEAPKLGIGGQLGGQAEAGRCDFLQFRGRIGRAVDFLKIAIGLEAVLNALESGDGIGINGLRFHGGDDS